MELVYRLGWTFIHSLWEGAAIAAIAWVALTALSRRSAQVRYLIHVTALMATLAAFAATFFLSPRLLSPTRSTVDERPATLSGMVLHVADQSVPTPSISQEHQSVAQSSAVAVSIARWIDTVSPTIGEFWLSCVLLLGVWRIAAWISVQRLRVVKTAPVDSMILQTAQRLAERLNVGGPFEVLLSYFAETPMVIGWLRPVILIPASMVTGLSSQQLEGILAHELAHIRRHDYLVNLLQILAETALFYHPAVWWISNQIRLEREQACDDVALSVCTDRREYARSLAILEELRFGGSAALAAGGSGGRQMLARIRRILRPTDDSPRRDMRGILSVLLILLIAGASYRQLKADPAGKPAPTSQPFVLHNDARRLSPFTAVRYRDDMVDVQFQNTWYKLVSINDLPAGQVMDYLKKSNDFAPEKHFAEDLVEVMRDMGHPTGDTVKLELETLDSRRAVTVPDAPMTEENRRAVLIADNSERPNHREPTADDIFKFDIAFKQGRTQFLDGDQITITSVKGTSADMESGICCISGTYQLASHKHATLAASVTASEHKDAVGQWNASQNISIPNGTGSFKLLLPISITGWPHVSFYDGNSFGGVYIGTGNWVLQAATHQ